MIGPDRTMPSPTPTPRMDERNPILPDDAEGQREHRATGARDDPSEQHDRQGGGEGANKGAQGKHDQDRRQDPFLPLHVTHPAQDGRADGGAEQVAGEQPGHGVGRRMQRVLQRRQGGNDQRLHDGERQRRQGEDGERQLVMRPFGFDCPATCHRDLAPSARPSFPLESNPEAESFIPLQWFRSVRRRPVQGGDGTDERASQCVRRATGGPRRARDRPTTPVETLRYAAGRTGNGARSRFGSRPHPPFATIWSYHW